MNFSKAFDTINHYLLDKLGAYGFDSASLELIRSYLTNCFQRMKKNKSYSSCKKIVFGNTSRICTGTTFV